MNITSPPGVFALCAASIAVFASWFPFAADSLSFAAHAVRSSSVGKHLWDAFDSLFIALSFRFAEVRLETTKHVHHRSLDEGCCCGFDILRPHEVACRTHKKLERDRYNWLPVKLRVLTDVESRYAEIELDRLFGLVHVTPGKGPSILTRQGLGRQGVITRRRLRGRRSEL